MVDDDLDREWGLEDFVSNEQIEEDEPWDRDDEVFADIELTSVIDVRELIEPWKKWGKVFDPILWPPVYITNKGIAIEGPKEAQVVEKIEVGINWVRMTRYCRLVYM